MMPNVLPALSACYIVTSRLGTGHQMRRPALLGAGDFAHGEQVAGSSLNGDVTQVGTESFRLLDAAGDDGKKVSTGLAGQTPRTPHTALQILAHDIAPEHTTVRFIRPAIKKKETHIQQ